MFIPPNAKLGFYSQQAVNFGCGTNWAKTGRESNFPFRFEWDYGTNDRGWS